MAPDNPWANGAWVPRPGVGLRYHTADEVEAYIGLLMLARGDAGEQQCKANPGVCSNQHIGRAVLTTHANKSEEAATGGSGDKRTL